MKSLFTYAVTLFLITNHCLADVFDTIQKTNTIRTGKYNAPLSPRTDPKDPMELAKLSAETTKIDSLLTKNVNTKVHASKEQQKKALQAVFSTEIIYGAARPSYLDGINTTSDIYGHCYVLEYSARLASEYLNSASGSINVNTTAYQKLYLYSGLDSGTLIGWLFEMRDQHQSGKQTRIQRSNALTVKSKPFTSVPLPTPAQFVTSRLPSSHTSTYPKATSAEKSQFIEDIRAQTNQFLQLPHEQLQSLGSMVIPPTQLAQFAAEWNRMGILPDADFSEFQSKQALTRTASKEDYTRGMFGQNLPAHIQRQIDETKRQIADQRGRFLSGGFAASAVRMPAPPVVQSKGGEWTEIFNLKKGGQIERTPAAVFLKTGGFSSGGKSLQMTNSSMNGTIINVHVSTDMTRDEFVASLRRDGNL